MQDAWYLVQHKDCPNLYWAFAQLPNLADNWKRSLAYEKHFLELQFSQLAEVDTQIKSVEYWRQFIDRLNEDMNANGVLNRSTRTQQLKSTFWQ
jgi:ubiquitin C-terminal hydrolase